MKRKKIEIKNSNKIEINNISNNFFLNKNLRENSMKEFKEELKTIYNEGSMVENHEKVIMLLKEITKEEIPPPPKEMTLKERTLDKIKRGYKVQGRRKTWPKWLQEAVPPRRYFDDSQG